MSDQTEPNKIAFDSSPVASNRLFKCSQRKSSGSCKFDDTVLSAHGTSEFTPEELDNETGKSKPGVTQKGDIRRMLFQNRLAKGEVFSSSERGEKLSQKCNTSPRTAFKFGSFTGHDNIVKIGACVKAYNGCQQGNIKNSCIFSGVELPSFSRSKFNNFRYTSGSSSQFGTGLTRNANGFSVQNAFVSENFDFSEKSENLKQKFKSSIPGTTIKFTALVTTEAVVKYVKVRYQCITCMKEYENKSLEELRLEDSKLGLF